MMILREEFRRSVLDMTWFEVRITDLVLADITISILEVRCLFNGLSWSLGLNMSPVFLMLLELH